MQICAACFTAGEIWVSVSVSFRFEFEFEHVTSLFYPLFIITYRSAFIHPILFISFPQCFYSEKYTFSLSSCLLFASVYWLGVSATPREKITLFVRPAFKILKNRQESPVLLWLMMTSFFHPPRTYGAPKLAPITEARTKNRQTNKTNE